MIGVLLAASLFGRVSVADLRERPVTATYKTELPARALAQCIAERVAYAGVPTIIETDEGLSVAVVDGGYAMALFDIGHGEVTVRRSVSTYRYKKKLEACLRA